MIVRLIDTSGGISADTLRAVAKQIKVGDHVVMFDHEIHDAGVMESDAEIAALQWKGGGGTEIAAALAHVEAVAPGQPIYCYTDGLFAGGFGYDNPAVRESAAFKANGFKIIDLAAEAA